MWYKTIETITEGMNTQIKVNGTTVEGVKYFKMEGTAEEPTEITLHTDIALMEWKDCDDGNETEKYNGYSFKEIESIADRYEFRINKLTHEIIDYFQAACIRRFPLWAWLPQTIISIVALVIALNTIK